jgi:hypothetical protein
MPVISAPGRLRPEDHEFKVSLSYILRPCLKKKKKSSYLKKSMLLSGVIN